MQNSNRTILMIKHSLFSDASVYIIVNKFDYTLKRIIKIIWNYSTNNSIIQLIPMNQMAHCIF